MDGMGDGFSGEILGWFFWQMEDKLSETLLSEDMDEFRLAIDGFEVFLLKKGDKHVIFFSRVAAWDDDL